jgi:DNA repair photolyase
MMCPPSARVDLKKVVSASRRTELLAHYPDRLVQRLREIGPGEIHTVVIWTKDPSHLLTRREVRAVLAEVGQVFVHWTITGLGGTFLEPNVPPPERQLALLDDVVDYLGDPRRCHWRWDPLISAVRAGERAGNVDLDLFRSLAGPIARAGVPAVHTSFATMYRKVIRRLAAAGVEVDEQGAELRGSFLANLSAAATEVGLELLPCCESGRAMTRCIDGELLADLHPAGERCRTDRARGQRRRCGCTASLDIGHYLPCPNRCLYCYAHPACGAAGG